MKNLTPTSTSCNLLLLLLLLLLTPTTCDLPRLLHLILLNYSHFWNRNPNFFKWSGLPISSLLLWSSWIQGNPKSRTNAPTYAILGAQENKLQNVLAQSLLLSVPLFLYHPFPTDNSVKQTCTNLIPPLISSRWNFPPSSGGFCFNIMHIAHLGVHRFSMPICVVIGQAESLLIK